MITDKELEQDLKDLKDSIHFINFDRVIELWDQQVESNKSYYNPTMMAHAANIENLLMQLKEELRAFHEAGDHNTNPNALRVKALADMCEKMIGDMPDFLDDDY
jgi:hypothetical protein